MNKNKPSIIIYEIIDKQLNNILKDNYYLDDDENANEYDGDDNDDQYDDDDKEYDDEYDD